MPAIAVISAAVLRTGRELFGETFEARAGAGLDLAAGIEAGTQALWNVPGPQVDVLAHALGPELSEMRPIGGEMSAPRVMTMPEPMPLPKPTPGVCFGLFLQFLAR